MFIRRQWYVLGWADELAQGLLARTVMNEPIVAFRTAGGEVAALEDRCCHRALPLSMGSVEGDRLRCVYHGLEYDTQGRCVRIPGQDAIPRNFCVKRYPLVEKDRMLWIWMGEADEARRETVPDYPFHDDGSHWLSAYGAMQVACHYELIHDNLLDLTHLAYVHPHTIGGNADVHFSADMQIEEQGEWLFTRRWMPGTPPPPTYARSVRLAERVDRWQEIRFRPGLVLNYSGAVDAGRDPADATIGYRARNLNALTPETETRTHYFYSASHGHNLDDPAWTQQHFDQIQRTFLEDVAILTRQQEAISRDASRELRMVAADRASARARRLVRERLAAEASSRGPTPIRIELAAAE